MVQNELTHWGVKGMKWGVRRTAAQLGRTSSFNSTQERKKPFGVVMDGDGWTPKKKPFGVDPTVMDGDGQTPKRKAPITAKYAKGTDKKQSVKDARPSVKDMSDVELRQKLNRLQMEKQYEQLTKEEINKGKKSVDKILKTAATIASVTTTAITIYNNLRKLGKIADEVRTKANTLGLKDTVIQA